MSNLMDVNERLFRELDRLDAVDVGDREALEAEVERARAIGGMVGRVVENAKTMMEAARMQADAMDGVAAQVGTSRLLIGEPTVIVRVEDAEEGD